MPDAEHEAGIRVNSVARILIATLLAVAIGAVVYALLNLHIVGGQQPRTGSTPHPTPALTPHATQAPGTGPTIAIQPGAPPSTTRATTRPPTTSPTPTPARTFVTRPPTTSPTPLACLTSPVVDACIHRFPLQGANTVTIPNAYDPEPVATDNGPHSADGEQDVDQTPTPFPGSPSLSHEGVE